MGGTKKRGKRVISVEMYGEGEGLGGWKGCENRGRERAKSAVMFAYTKSFAPSDSHAAKSSEERRDAFYRKRRLMRRASREPQEMFPRNPSKNYADRAALQNFIAHFTVTCYKLSDFRYFHFLIQSSGKVCYYAQFTFFIRFWFSTLLKVSIRLVSIRFNFCNKNLSTMKY